MENIYDFGRVSYVPAESVEKISTFKKCLFIRDLLIDIIKLVVFGIPHLFIATYHLFVSPTKKSVAGQTVLVF